MMNLKLKSKLMMIFILTGIFPMILIGGIAFQQSRSALQQETYSKIHMFSEVVKDDFDAFFGSRLTNITILGDTARVATAIEARQKTPHLWNNYYDQLEAFLPSYANRLGYDAVFVTLPEGETVYASGPMKNAMEGANLTQREYFQRAMKGETNISEFMYSSVIDTYFVAVATPVRNSNGQIVGTISGLILTDDIQKMVQESAHLLGRTAEVFLVDETGLLYTNMISGPYESGAALTESIQSPGVDLLRSAIKNRNTDFYQRLSSTNYADEPIIGGYSVVEIGSTPLGLAVEVNQSEAYAPVNRLLRTIFIILLLIIVLSFLIVSVFFKKSILNPINTLKMASTTMANGDLNIEIDIHSHDEIGELSEQFMKMCDQINDVLTQIQSASEHVHSGSNQVADSSMALSQGATEQASSIQQITASIQEITEQTLQNVDKAKKAVQLAESTKNEAYSGNEHMKQMLDSMESINRSSNEISKIIKVIDEIAFQTNILALNAAVEAARAGEHGKGFAVVADEVRNLAARSANAAKETTSMIEESIKRVEEGTEIAHDTASALETIVQSVEEVRGNIEVITQASTHQATSIEQINQGIHQISDVVQTTSATSEETAAASEELSGQSELLNDQVNRFILKRK